MHKRSSEDDAPQAENFSSPTLREDTAPYNNRIQSKIPAQPGPASAASEERYDVDPQLAENTVPDTMSQDQDGIQAIAGSLKYAIDPWRGPLDAPSQVLERIFNMGGKREKKDIPDPKPVRHSPMRLEPAVAEQFRRAEEHSEVKAAADGGWTNRPGMAGNPLPAPPPAPAAHPLIGNAQTGFNGRIYPSTQSGGLLGQDRGRFAPVHWADTHPQTTAPLHPGMGDVRIAEDQRKLPRFSGVPASPVMAKPLKSPVPAAPTVMAKSGDVKAADEAVKPPKFDPAQMFSTASQGATLGGVLGALTGAHKDSLGIRRGAARGALTAGGVILGHGLGQLAGYHLGGADQTELGGLLGAGVGGLSGWVGADKLVNAYIRQKKEEVHAMRDSDRTGEHGPSGISATGDNREKKAVHVERGGPVSRIASNTVGRVLGLPALLATPKALSDPGTDKNRGKHEALAQAMDKARPEQLKDTVVRLGGGNLVDDILWKKERDGELPWYKQLGGRVWHNPHTSILGKLFGTVTTPVSGLLAPLTRGSRYNSETDAAEIYADSPAITSHELGHAIDFNKKNAPPGSSTGRRIGGQVLRDLYRQTYQPGLNLWHEGKANTESASALRDAYKGKQYKQKLDDVMDERQRVLPAGYGSYIGQSLSPLVGPVAPFLGLMAGRAYGAAAADYNKQYKQHDKNPRYAKAGRHKAAGLPDTSEVLAQLAAHGVLGSAIGAAPGMLIGMGRGNAAEGLGRGIIRGGMTGLGSGTGRIAGRAIGEVLGNAQLGDALGGGVGGGLGYMAASEQLGQPDADRVREMHARHKAAGIKRADRFESSGGDFGAPATGAPLRKLQVFGNSLVNQAREHLQPRPGSVAGSWQAGNNVKRTIEHGNMPALADLRELQGGLASAKDWITKATHHDAAPVSQAASAATDSPIMPEFAPEPPPFLGPGGKPPEPTAPELPALLQDSQYGHYETPPSWIDTLRGYGNKALEHVQAHLPEYGIGAAGVGLGGLGLMALSRNRRRRDEEDED